MMNNARFNIRVILLCTLLFLLVLPFIQSKFQFIKVRELKGAVTQAKIKPITLTGWFSGDFQKNREEYLTSTFGFRNLFIRLNNQIAFTFFNKANANSVVIGKNGYLYEENYIKAYYGRDYIGKEKIKERLAKVKHIQDTFSRMNKDIILVFAPGKGSYYPEYIPDNLKSEHSTTNYETHIQIADQLGLNYIDFNKYFIDIKNTSEYPLYPQYGIHWSKYGGYIAADSMVKYVERIRDIDMPDYSFDTVDMDQPRGEDYDIANGMNIMFRLKTYDLAYPRLIHKPDSGYIKPSLLVISDSYYWTLYSTSIIKKGFSKQQFWFYNNTVFPAPKTTYTTELDLKSEIDKHDVIVLMSTDASLPGFGWRFIDNTYDLFKKEAENIPLDSQMIKKITSLKESMQKDQKWMAKIERKAASNKISIDSMMTLDAIWLIKQKNNKISQSL